MLNIFNSKYRRSEWMEGLLYAEEWIQKGAKVALGYGCKDLSGYAYNRVEVKYEGAQLLQYCNREFKDGVKDYLDFIKNSS